MTELANQELQRVRRAYFDLQCAHSLLLEGAGDGLWEWDARSRVLTLSAQGMKLLGQESAEVGPLADWQERLHPEDLPTIRQLLLEHLAPDRPVFDYECRLLHASGAYRWVRVRGAALFGDNKQPFRLAGSISDIEGQRRLEEQLTRQAYHAPLTGLPNRTLFLRRLQRVVTGAARGASYAVLFLDVDRFKMINDSLGHLTGDELLVAIATRLQTCLRPEDLVARLGGDEFVILLDTIQDVG